MDTVYRIHFTNDTGITFDNEFVLEVRAEDQEQAVEVACQLLSIEAEWIDRIEVKGGNR